MAWSKVTAGGSATTWTPSDASTVTWGDWGSGASFIWIPFSTRTDLWQGVDFVPKTVTEGAPLKLNAVRPLALWNLSAVTSSAFTAERKP